MDRHIPGIFYMIKDNSNVGTNDGIKFNILIQQVKHLIIIIIENHQTSIMLWRACRLEAITEQV